MKKLLLLLLSAACTFAESEWNADVAYACWSGEKRCINMALLHVQGEQRLLPGDGGTWLRAELSASWRMQGKDFLSGSASHADYFGPRKLYLPELALKQCFGGDRAYIVAGMVNLTNDLDAVGIANDSFATFAHSAFTNSTVLPLPDANAGAVLRVDFSEKDHAILGVSRTGAPPGGNPFRSGPPGVCVVGEYGHAFQEPAITLRLNPFYSHRHGGLAASMEYEVDDNVTLFSRAGVGRGGDTGSTADFSCGATLKPIPSRPDDLLGIACAFTKAGSRECVLEVMYSFQAADHLKLMPHIQYSSREEWLFGIQAVFSF